MIGLIFQILLFPTLCLEPFCVDAIFSGRLSGKERQADTEDVRSTFDVNRINPQETMIEFPPELAPFDKWKSMCELCPQCYSCAKEQRSQPPKFDDDYFLICSYSNRISKDDLMDYVKKKLAADFKRTGLSPLILSHESCAISLSALPGSMSACDCVGRPTTIYMEISGIEKIFTPKTLTINCQQEQCVAEINVAKGESMTFFETVTQRRKKDNRTGSYDHDIEVADFDIQVKTMVTDEGQESYYGVSKTDISSLIATITSKPDLRRGFVMALEILNASVWNEFNYCYDVEQKKTEPIGFFQYEDWPPKPDEQPKTTEATE